MRPIRLSAPFLIGLAVVGVSTPAFAHADGALTGGLVAGLAHPLLGWDHIAAMLAVGLWGAFLRAPAVWLLPIVFPAVMVAGGALAGMGVALPAVEAGIAASVLALGLLLALAARPPLWLAAILVAVFAVFHGHAHGGELPATANAVTYVLGFVVATAFLHIAGIACGLLLRRPVGVVALRAGGGGIALAGLAFMAGVA